MRTFSSELAIAERRMVQLLAHARRTRPLGQPGSRARWHLRGEEPQRLCARLLQSNAVATKHSGRDPRLLPQQAEQQVLSADVGVVELPRLAHCELQQLLCERCTAGQRPPCCPLSPS